MESLSFPMCVQLSGAVVQAWPQAQEQSVCLGERHVKGKGLMTTYLLKVRRVVGVGREGGPRRRSSRCAWASELSELRQREGQWQAVAMLAAPCSPVHDARQAAQGSTLHAST